jgi:hypothetical protein
MQSIVKRKERKKKQMNAIIVEVQFVYRKPFFKFYLALALNPAWPAGRLTPTSGLVLKKSTLN